MIKKTDITQTASPIRFYDVLASKYDEMTGFEQRFANESPHFRLIVKRFNLNTALDAGCGTGFHSILLAQLGLEVTAVDISEKMLIQTRTHAKDYGFPIETIASSFPKLKNNVNTKFDSVFCLGNTIANILTEKELFDSLKSFHEVLNPDGILFFQILNYDRILKSRERIQSIKKAGSKIFIRFYDYEKKNICFNILTIEEKNDMLVHSLNSVQLHPWRASDVIRVLHRAGFTEPKLYGNIAMEKYFAHSSKDLIVLAKSKNNSNIKNRVK